MNQNDFQDKTLDALESIRVSVGQLAVAQSAHERRDDDRFGSINAWTKGIALLIVGAIVMHFATLPAQASQPQPSQSAH